MPLRFLAKVPNRVDVQVCKLRFALSKCLSVFLFSERPCKHMPNASAVRIWGPYVDVIGLVNLSCPCRRGDRYSNANAYMSFGEFSLSLSPQQHLTLRQSLTVDCSFRGTLQPMGLSTRISRPTFLYTCTHY